MTLTPQNRIGDIDFYSVFQPIYSFSNQACIGAEVLIRGDSVQTGKAVPVPRCLEVPASYSGKGFTRFLNDLHLGNWSKTKRKQDWLFLNFDVQKLTKLEDVCLADLFHQHQINANQVVIEVVEKEITDEGLFSEFLAMLRELGCMIALDDFGAGHSNVDRIWKAQPEIVKLDREILIEASNSQRSQSILYNLTRLIKESGSLALLEGIETHEQALIAMDNGVDLVQGYFFAKPDRDMSRCQAGEKLTRQITEDYSWFQSEKEVKYRIKKMGFGSLFSRIQAAENYMEIEAALHSLVSLSFVKRFFILDQHGYQISDEKIFEKSGAATLKRGKGLCWKNRNYFTQALKNQQEVFLSSSYRSQVDMKLCFTVSQAVHLENGDVFVACLDLFYEEGALEPENNPSGISVGRNEHDGYTA